MKKAPILRDEIERLKALVEYHILETPPEKDFDELVELASQICETPIALISFIDGDRQWYKAKIGVDATETPRELTFCGHAIANSDLMIVNDASKDERFFDNPAVTIGGIKFYAGAPLLSASGHNIGTLCIAGPLPKELTPKQGDFLRTLSKQVMTLVEYRKKVMVLSETIKSFQEIVKDLDLNQNDLLNADKIDSISGLASGVAHEINNPLTIIMITANILQKKLKDNDTKDLAQGLDNIEKTIHRMVGVVRELKNLSEMPLENFADGKTLRDSFSNAISAKR